MKTAELTGAQLDYWVARALGYRFWKETRGRTDPITLCVCQLPGEREPWMRTQSWVAAKERYTEAHTFDDVQIGFFGTGIPKFSTDWAQGGPIIQREGIQLSVGNYFKDPGGAGFTWFAETWTNPPAKGQADDSPLIAAMRAYVASKFGDEVPDDSIA
jgi:hypothetical protein